MNKITQKYPRFMLSLIVVFIFLLLFLQQSNSFLFNIDQRTVNKLKETYTFFKSIIIQSFPFLILGITISSVLSAKLHLSIFQFIKLRFTKTLYLFLKIKNKIYKVTLIRILVNSNFFKHLYVAFIGILFPVCECGNIPLARQLMLQGFTVSQSITFVLAAPIINPITLLTTYIAFGNINIVIFRFIFGLITSVGIGLLISKFPNQIDLLTPKFYSNLCHRNEISINKSNRFIHFINDFQKEFINLFSVLIIGSFIASFLQVFINRETFIDISSNQLFSIFSMQALAFVISVCSSVDSFIALSYSNFFTNGAIISYLLFGPMVDIKILTMLKPTFKNKTLILIIILVFLYTTLFGLLSNLLL